MGEIAPEAPEKRAKEDFFVMNIMHSFGHFCFTDFHETWQELLNQCA